MRSAVKLFVVVVLVLGSSFQASALELLANPGFESGLTGWTVTNLAGSLGTFMPAGPNGSPPPPGLSPLSGFPTAGPHTGTGYAITDQQNSGSAGTHALSQLFTIPGPSQLITLSFWVFVDDQRNSTPINNGLDHNNIPNAHTRVDLMTAASPIFSTAGGDILAQLYLGNGLLNNQPPTLGGCNIAAPPFYCPWQFVTLDITGLVTPGQTYLLRFADVTTQLFYQTGVDDVSVNFLVPEPGTLVLCGLGLLGAGWFRRRKRAA